MSKKDKLISQGLDGLIVPPTPEPQAPATSSAPATDRTKGNYKTVCYSIPPEIAEIIKDIAYWDRKKINAVVVEAFEAYIEAWDAKNKR